MTKAGILVHISDRDKWLQLLNQTGAFLATAGVDEWKVIVVADIFAGAVCIACNQSLREKMMEFVAAGHKILVCEESLRCLNIQPESLPEFVQSIPNGLAEIIQMQAEGFHYIKI